MSKQPVKPPQAGTSKRKSGNQTKPNPPELNVDALPDVAKSLLNKALSHLEQSGNLKTTIKEAVIGSLQGLYEIVGQINESRLSIKNNLEIVIARRKTEHDDPTIDKPMIDGIITSMNKIGEGVNAQGKLSEQTTKLLQCMIEEIRQIKTTATPDETALLEVISNQNAINKQTSQALVMLAEDLQELKEQPKPEPVKQQESPERKTYAEAVSVPTPKPTLCLLVGTEDPIDTSEDVVTKIRESLKAKETGLQISKIRKVKDQRVLIGSENKEDYEKIKETLQKNKFKIEEKANKDPLVIIRNVNKSNTDEDILTAIKTQNKHLIQDIPDEQNRMTIRHRRRARNPLETHIVMQVSPMVWKALTMAGKIYVDLQRVPVFDLSPLVQCSRCLCFGHGKKWCTETTDLCSHCSGPHMREECPSRLAEEEPTCKNCQQAKYHDTSHNAFDTACPVRLKWDALARSSVAYC